MNLIEKFNEALKINDSDSFRLEVEMLLSSTPCLITDHIINYFNSGDNKIIFRKDHKIVAIASNCLYVRTKGKYNSVYYTLIPSIGSGFMWSPLV